MANVKLKTHYTAQELADFNLSGLPKTRPGIVDRAKKGGWETRLRSGRGGGVEYDIDSLPATVKEEIREIALSQIITSDSSKKVIVPENQTAVMLETVRRCPAEKVKRLGNINSDQRACAEARCALVAEVLKLENMGGMKRLPAIKYLIEKARVGDLPPALMKMVELANNKKGETRILGIRSLNQWVLDYLRTNDSAERLLVLTPKLRGEKRPEHTPWFLRFMRHWRNPNGVSRVEAYEDFCAEWAEEFADQPTMLAALPSLDAVTRMLRKLPKLELMRGRVTGGAWRSLQSFVRRDWSDLQVNDVWIGDGHGMKLKVQHPLTGSPFKPELTLIIDGTTRYIVGWSISLSENVIAVADALRFGMEKCGLPLFYYSDNGGGQKNKIFDAELTGILPRLGIGHETGIPGNPQGRGIIERAHKTILIRCARKFETFNGSSVDRDTSRKVAIGIESATNALRQGKELNEAQQRSMTKLPTWSELIDAVIDGIDYYNTRHPHDSLPKKANGKHYTPAEYRAECLKTVQPHYMTEAELREMFRPHFTRKASRGEVHVFNNIYFSEALMNVDGDEVMVGVDIHNANTVVVRRMTGEFVCEAVWDGNKRAAFPVSMVEKARDDRAARRSSGIEKKLDEVERERNPVLTIENAPDFSQLLQPDLTSLPHEDDEPLCFYEFEREEWLANKQKKA